MPTRIPLPGNMIDTLMNGVKTGSGMYTGIMNPILNRENQAIEREKQKQQAAQFQQELALKQAASGRNSALFSYRLQELKDKHAASEFDRRMQNELFGGSQGSQGNQVQGDQYPALNKMFSGQGMFSGGELEHGNLDLGNRPKVSNPETGGMSTVYSMSIGTPKGEVLIPRVSDDGRILTEPEAIEQFHKTGKHMGIYSSPEEATKAAEMIHQQQASSVGAKPGQHLLDVLRNDPIKRGYFKYKYKFDPLAPAPQTPEDKQAAAIDLFKQKQELKNQNNGGENPTNAVLTQNQQAIQGIDTVIPMLDDLIDNPSKVYGKWDFGQSKKAAYNAKTSGMIDTLVAAQSLPKVQASIDLVEQQIRRATGESNTAYIERLKDLRKDLIHRRGKAQSVIKNRKVNAGSLQPTIEETKTLNGKTYQKINGEWHEV